jgi:putative MATE family efflux protein
LHRLQHLFLMNLAVDRSITSRILGLAGPVVLAMLSQTALNQVDHALIGRLPLAEATPGQSAATTSLILLWAVGGLLSALAVGTQALTARRAGEQDPERAGQVMLNSVTVGLVTSIIAVAIVWPLVPAIFPKVERDPDVIRLGIPFLRWRIVGVVSMVTTNAYKSWFDGLGHTRVHMVASIVMNVINIFLNYALVFGYWGAPALGVEGSGLASCISSYIGLFIMIAWSMRPTYRHTYHNYNVGKVSRKQQWEIIKLSAPSGIATVFVMSGFGLFKYIVGTLDAKAGHGPIYGAATANLITILLLFFTACMAYGTATATLVGQSMGAKQPELAERYAYGAVKLGVYIAIALGVLVVFFPDTLMHVYCKDEAVIAVARPVLRICGALLPVILAAIVFTQALFGAGNTVFVMLVEFGLHFFCLVPLAYLLGVVAGWGVMGVWMSAFAYVILLCLIMGAKFASGTWKDIKL